jgi:transposase
MNEITPVKPPVKRRRFSKAFKAKIVAACDQPGASVAGVALANGLNANLVHRWRKSAKDQGESVSGQADFLPVPLSVPANDAPASVIIEVHGVKLHWPLSHIDQSIAWLRALPA